MNDLNDFSFSELFGKLIVGVVIIGCIASFAVSCYAPVNKAIDRRDVVATVTDKAVKRIHKQDTYLVYTETENGEILVLCIVDSLLGGRFNSADVYAGIKTGKTYKFDIAGERNELLSWYPNIYGYEEIATGKESR